VAQDHAEAVKLFRLAAEQGYASAQNNLGFMYAYGRGVPQDYAEAAKWYRVKQKLGNQVRVQRRSQGSSNPKQPARQGESTDGKRRD